jgi:hypothetical protein
MAQCSKCGTKVGCGCQLVNGVCLYCRKTAKRVIKFYNDVTTTPN